MRHGAIFTAGPMQATCCVQASSFRHTSQTYCTRSILFLKTALCNLKGFREEELSIRMIRAPLSARTRSPQNRATEKGRQNPPKPVNSGPPYVVGTESRANKGQKRTDVNHGNKRGRENGVVPKIDQGKLRDPESRQWTLLPTPVSRYKDN